VKPITLAVVSDLHIGSKARSRDLCPRESEATESDFRHKFKAFIKGSKVKADFLIVAGDISSIAAPDEFKLCSEIVLEIANTLSVQNNNILFVPGNHDVNWSVLQIDPADQSKFWASQRYAPLAHSDWMFSKLLTSQQGNGLTAPYYWIRNFKTVLSAGYNSAWRDNPDEHVHHGLVSQDHLEQLDKDLAKHKKSNSQLRLFMVHHHPLQYSDPIPDEPDFSAMTNAENLLSLLRKHNFDVLIHGHKHVPRFKIHGLESGFPLAILGAGSFSATLDTRWSGLVSNQFHLLRIEGRVKEEGYIRGVLKNWTYLSGRGWVPSEGHSGIVHRLAFGAYIASNKLKSSLKNEIAKAFAHSDFVDWNTLAKKLPYLEYLPFDQLTDALDELSGQLYFQRRGTTPDELLVLRNK